MNPRADAAASRLEVQGDNAAVSGRYRFVAALPVFAGHFPGRPLLPGVHQVACVVDAVAQALGRPLRVTAIERCKWSAPVPPDAEVTVSAVSAPVDGGWRLDGEVRLGATVACACRVRVAAV